MSIKDQAVLLAVFASSLLIQCKTASPSSELKYGALGDEPFPRSYLIHAGPGDKIVVCGSERDIVTRAIGSWLEATGRSSLELVSQNACPSLSANWNYLVEAARSSNNPQVRELCRLNPDMMMYAQDHDYGVSGKKLLIGRCQGELGALEEAWAVSHEVGHSFGLCDQYEINEAGELSSVVGMHRNCSPIFRSREAVRSVMSGALYYLEEGEQAAKGMWLTPHDVTAVRLMACRTDIAGNKAWLVKHPELAGKWRQEKHFRDEIHRLQGEGVSFHTACLGDGPGVEGAYEKESRGYIECCVCQHQDYQKSSSFFAGDQKLGASYYTFSNIQNGPFEQTTCYQRQRAKVDLATPGQYAYTEVCNRRTVVGSLCVRAPESLDAVSISNPEADAVETMQPIGKGRYQLSPK